MGTRGHVRKRMLRRLAGAGLAGLVLLGAAAGAMALALRNLPPLPLAAAEAVSATVVDRRDRLLRAFTTEHGRWRLPVEPAEVDQRYLAMLLAFEDRRFRAHAGVDPVAVGRAAVQLARHRRVVSGGSTLTMQVARLLDGEHARTGAGKLRQMLRAVQIERRLSKDEILRLYLRLAPFGGNIEGVRAAAWAYFGKEPRRLSIGEAALLVALPQSPELRRPDRAAKAAERARNRVLAVAAERGVISREDEARARREPVPTVRREFPRLAPHLAESEVAADPARGVHRTTLDRDLQGQLETLAREHARALGARLSAAILVADHATGEVLAHVGSSDYRDEERLGAIDMVRAVRSPGSTLKPIIYGLAFEAGLAHPETLIEDRPARFGTYAPKNFDEEFHGTITVREALAQSLNVPAVKALEAVGPGRLIGRFRRTGLVPVLPGKGEPTLAIALGGVGLRLADLASLYAGLARGGEAIELGHRRGHMPASSRPERWRVRNLLSPAAAWYVTDILKDAPPPASARGGRIAYKTGTSYGYRDAWAIGYDGRYVIAVWAGRADGATSLSLTGRTAAAPILFDAFARISERPAPFAPPPAGVLRVAGGDLPPPLKRFAESGAGDGAPATGPYLSSPVAIAFPPDRAELALENGEEAIVLKAEGGVLPLTWMIDGAPVAGAEGRRELEWRPAGRGFVRVSVVDADGRVDRVTVRLK